jgi:hypothetical protein
MINKIRATALAALALTALAVAAPASAAYVLQTATAGSGGSGSYPIYTDAAVGNGDGTDGGSTFIGAGFTLGGSVSSLQVGANVDALGSGSVFAEIVALPSAGSLPPATGGNLVAWLQTHSLGEATLTAPASAGDASTVINFSSALAAGDYAVIFGSGLYGTTGGINLTDGNATIPSPNIFTSLGGDSFQSYGYDSQIRIFAATVPVPLPAGLPLLVSGLLAGVGGFLRGRRPAPAAG